jgi:hypothetical protein
VTWRLLPAPSLFTSKPCCPAHHITSQPAHLLQLSWATSHDTLPHSRTLMSSSSVLQHHCITAPAPVPHLSLNSSKPQVPDPRCSCSSIASSHLLPCLDHQTIRCGLCHCSRCWLAAEEASSSEPEVRHVTRVAPRCVPVLQVLPRLPACHLAPPLPTMSAASSSHQVSHVVAPSGCCDLVALSLLTCSWCAACSSFTAGCRG